MEKFEVNILGCGSAVPTGRHMTTAQLVNIHEKVFLVDCGEGTQIQIWKSGIKVTNMNHIFISHAHGDHFFGLLPFLSSFGLMLGRTEDLDVYMPMSLKDNFERDLTAYCYIPFKVNLHAIDGNKRQILYEDGEMSIETIPLKHVVPCCGFLFREKHKARVLLPEKCLSYGISTREFGKIKAGSDYTLADGTVIPNEELTAVSDFIPRSYAFCSDTAYYPEMVPQIEGVDVLYHESTFTSEKEDQATIVGHSTAEQAAMIARAAKVGLLVLGHYSIRYAGGTKEFINEARCIFGNSIASEEGMTIPILHTEYSDVVEDGGHPPIQNRGIRSRYMTMNRTSNNHIMDINRILKLNIPDIHPAYGGVRGKTMSSRSQEYAWPVIKEAGVHTIIDLRNDGINQRMMNLCKEYGMEYFYYPVDNRADVVESMVALFPEFCERIDRGGFYIACAMGLHRTDIALSTYWVFYGADKGIEPPTLRGYLRESGHDTSKILRVLNAFYDKLTERDGKEPMPIEEFKRRKQVINEQSKLSTSLIGLEMLSQTL